MLIVYFNNYFTVTMIFMIKHFLMVISLDYDKSMFNIARERSEDMYSSCRNRPSRLCSLVLRGTYISCSSLRPRS